MTENTKQITHLELPVAEMADLATKSARLGVSFPLYLGILVLQGAYGFAHPDVVAFRNRANAGVCGPETQEGEE